MAIKFVVCMGSSCYARGNEKNLAIIEDYLKKHKLDASVELSGTLCCDLCKEGPIIFINDKPYCKVDEGTILDILSEL